MQKKKKFRNLWLKHEKKDKNLTLEFHGSTDFTDVCNKNSPRTFTKS